MNRHPQRPGRGRKPLACAVVAALLAGGCGGPRAGYERFIPPEEAARRALETALTAWREGQPPGGVVRQAAPAIQLVDSQQKPGRKLAGFTVLGPTTGDADRCYAARLTFDGPREEVRARFVVFGQDPVWVMRYEDYEMMMHWCAPPADGKATAR
jgi:hypothetical protein